MIDDIEKINQYIIYAEKYDVIPNVIYYALNYLKENPDKSIYDALNFGQYTVLEKIYHVDYE